MRGWACVVVCAVAALCVAGCVEQAVCEVVARSVLGAGFCVVGLQGSAVPVVFWSFVHGFSAPPAGGAVFVVVDEAGAGFLVRPAESFLGFGELLVLHVTHLILACFCWLLCVFVATLMCRLL